MTQVSLCQKIHFPVYNLNSAYSFAYIAFYMAGMQHDPLKIFITSITKELRSGKRPKQRARK